MGFPWAFLPEVVGHSDHGSIGCPVRVGRLCDLSPCWLVIWQGLPGSQFAEPSDARLLPLTGPSLICRKSAFVISGLWVFLRRHNLLEACVVLNRVMFS